MDSGLRVQDLLEPEEAVFNRKARADNNGRIITSSSSNARSIFLDAMKKVEAIGKKLNDHQIKPLLNNERLQKLTMEEVANELHQVLRSPTAQILKTRDVLDHTLVICAKSLKPGEHQNTIAEALSMVPDLLNDAFNRFSQRRDDPAERMFQAFCEVITTELKEAIAWAINSGDNDKKRALASIGHDLKGKFHEFVEGQEKRLHSDIHGNTRLITGNRAVQNLINAGLVSDVDEFLHFQQIMPAGFMSDPEIAERLSAFRHFQKHNAGIRNEHFSLLMHGWSRGTRMNWFTVLNRSDTATENYHRDRLYAVAATMKSLAKKQGVAEPNGTDLRAHPLYFLSLRACALEC